MVVKARFKDAPDDEWFDVLLTDDQRMINVATKQEITRTDLLFKSSDDDEIIDMEKEWDEYKHEKLKEALHKQARYLAKQAEAYDKGIWPTVESII